MKPDGLTMYLSHYGPKETMDRFASAVAEHGFTILARIDHASAAAQVGIGDPAAAIPLEEKRIRLNPNDPNIALAYRHRALAKTAKGDRAGAEADMKMARTLDPRL